MISEYYNLITNRNSVDSRYINHTLVHAYTSDDPRLFSVYGNLGTAVSTKEAIGIAYRNRGTDYIPFSGVRTAVSDLFALFNLVYMRYDRAKLHNGGEFIRIIRFIRNRAVKRDSHTNGIKRAFGITHNACSIADVDHRDGVASLR